MKQVLSRSERGLARQGGRCWLLAAAIALAAAMIACDGAGGASGDPPPHGGVTPTLCTPSCDGSTCGDDGCGGTCDCGDGLVCDDQHTCVVSCDVTCEDAGWSCGELCGVSCGSCGDGSCLWNE